MRLRVTVVADALRAATGFVAIRAEKPLVPGNFDALAGHLERMPVGRCRRVNDAERRLWAALRLRVAGLRAVIAEHFAVRGYVLTIMAPKASGPVPMTDVHGIGMPIDAHVGEYGAVVDVACNRDGFVDVCFTVRQNLRIFRLIRANDGLSNSAVRGFPRRVLHHH